MSVNFNDATGLMVGADNHIFLMVVPPSPLPVPTPTWHVVGTPFMKEPTVKRIWKTKSDGWEMCKDGFDIYLVPHVPIPPGAPHPGEIAWLLTMVIAVSGSKCAMSVHSVTNGGDPLATCLISSIGTNMNCNDPLDLPTDVVINRNTVITSPTLGDYLGALFGAVVDSVISWAFGKLLGPAKNAGKRLLQNIYKQILRRLPDLLKMIPVIGDTLSALADIPGFVKKQIQQGVDDAVAWATGG